ncbi:hypothetical protein [Paenibacillus andongensis]|uniref:hypothetical protein n=1 Tax=Paenibacillus andongensis TaxID=2975482 RepID=UPI0021BB03BE|nr:hypothetical protein [Paenibacillus andongensis]
MLAVDEVNRLGNAELLDRSTEAVLHDGLIHDRVELAMEHKTRGIVDERDEKYLLH